ncbi:hypothetical protein [Streptomyces sp. NBC_01353]|uniref:hypothetical protein n=1 Tax=Streptomyces sp. NBC_01353 TaxID=2903835 RepID=UPI002E367664|nr:hypothetical protein [Streptomyces sp. NBC_01353]
MPIGPNTALILSASGCIFLGALLLGVWKWRAMVTSTNGLAHPYVDVAHRAALMYAFATGLIAAFVELSAWPSVVDLGAAAVIVTMFVVTITNYIRLALQRETDNQMRNAPRSMNFVLAALITGEIGGFGVLLAGLVAAQV